MEYANQYDNSINNPSRYWLERSQAINWYVPPSTGLTNTSDTQYNWFEDGLLNTCYLALDYHVEQGRGDTVAFYYDSPVTGVKQQLSYAQLLAQVSVFAGAMKRAGICKGDTVIIYMPMILQAPIAMLACARIGAIHSVVFGGFAASELAVRIDDIQAKMVITASCGIEVDKIIAYKPLVDEAIKQATHKPATTVVYQRETLTAQCSRASDIDWMDFIIGAEAAPCEILKSNDPRYILYTSGTTGKPKGVVRDNGGHAVALKLAFNDIYGLSAKDVWWAASDIGWVVGHSFIVYGPLICGASSVLYEGKPIKTPNAGAFWRVISDYKVSSMLCAPTAFRAIRGDDPQGACASHYDTSSLRWVFVAGERLDSSTYHWIADLLKVPVLDHWWQTETGWPITAPMMGLNNPRPTRVGSTNNCTPGYDLRILDEDGQEVSTGGVGNICLKLPLPPGVSTGIWNQPNRYHNAYLSTYAGFYKTGDGGYKDEQGYVYITGRTDDVINVAGHRLSTAEMEEIVSSHEAIAECAVVGATDALKGQVPIGLVVLKAGSKISNADLQTALIARVRQKIGAVACFKEVFVVNRLPKTRSGKILRAVLRKIAAAETFQIPATIDNPEILGEIKEYLKAR